MFKRNEPTSKSFRGGTNLLPSKTSNPKKAQVKTTSFSVVDKNCSSSSTSSVLSTANRFPFSSTPAASPTKENKNKDEVTVRVRKEDNENFKKPWKVSNLKLTGGGKMPKKFPNHGPLTATSISPIRRATSSSDYFGTQSRSNNVSFDRQTSASVEMSSFDSRPRLSSTMMSLAGSDYMEVTPFPFPNTQACIKVNRGGMLLDSLRILTVARILQIESTENQDQPTGKGNKKKDLKLDEAGFQFTEDMFKFVNSEACLHVLHLLFECYDPKETEILFRDSWPIYEKKMEGLFRRVALKWLKEIMDAYPNFFKSTRQEAVGGLLVNPGGERFIQLVESFAELVLFCLANANSQDGSKRIMNKPEFFEDAEITNRQILVLNTATECLRNGNDDVRKRMKKNSLELNKRIIIMNQRMDGCLNDQSELEKKVDRLMTLAMDSFIPAADNESDLCCNQLRPLLLRDINQKVVRFNADADMTLKATTQQLLEVLKSIDQSFGTYTRLWFILGMDRNRELVLDGSKLFFSLNQKENTGRSLQDFIKGIENTCNKLISDENLNATIPSLVLEKYKTSEFRLQYLKIIEQQMKDRKTFDISSLKMKFENQFKILETQLKDVNWQEFSKVDESQFTNYKAFKITPTKGYDLKKQTGFTPALLNFLPESKDEPDTSSYRNMSNVSSCRNVNVTRRNGNASGNVTVGFNQSEFHLSSSVMTPVSRFKAVNERSTVPKVIIGIQASNSTPPTPQNKHHSRENLTKDSEDDDSNGDAKSLNLSINIESSNSAVEVDISVRSDSMTPIGLDLSTQARIARIMGSLNSDSSRCSSVQVQPIFLDWDDSLKGTANRRLSSVGKINRMSLSSTHANNSELNLSLMDDWKDEKGIMDVSYALNESDSDN